ncbi:hypothetical protein GL4_2767 [Methyloceanibacter caenitepidi]|uniref:Uncharacterized protein n=1 Tax=Methyloceanibacter caenitepidi TaxID=1384459 RepID=A0A0A8K5W3_9HYPH|nr:hypothetical protein GL4_2767 [Methyloceanibacter caenitepidi]
MRLRDVLSTQVGPIAPHVGRTNDYDFRLSKDALACQISSP